MNPVLIGRVAARFSFEERYARLFQSMSLQEAKSVLGFPPGASPSPEEVAKAYKRKAIENHPDRGGSHEKMVEVNVAKDILDGKQRPDGARGRPQPRSGPSDGWRPQDKVPKKEKIKKGDDFASAKSKAPTPVEWKFRTSYMIGKESEFTKEQGINSYVAVWVCYGQTPNHHVFMLVEHAIPNQYADILFESWSMERVETYPLTQPIEKIAPKAIKSLSGTGKLSNGISKPATKYMAMEGLTELEFSRNSGGVALKDILIGTGLSSGAASDRKVVVEMAGKINKEKMKANKGISVLDAWRWYDFTLYVNGKAYPLSDTTIENLGKQGSSGRLFWMATYSSVKWDYERRRVLTKIPGYGSKLLEMIEESLSGEPAELTVTLLKAIESMEVTKKAASHLLTARVVSRFLYG